MAFCCSVIVELLLNPPAFIKTNETHMATSKIKQIFVFIAFVFNLHVLR